MAPPIDVTFVHPLDEPTTPTTIMHGTQHRGLVTGNFALVMPDTATLPGELCSRAAVFSDARGTGHRFSLPAFDISGSSCVPVTRSATTTTIGAPATVPPTTTTTAPTTTTTLAATTTSRPTTTTTGEVAATSTSQASTTTTRVLATTVPPPATLGTSFAATTTTVKVLGAVVTRAVKGQVGPAALAATGGSPANLLAFAGVALILGGITMLFGRRAPRTERS
jgi:LPXTG-motif cell wall-anchored protein